MLDNISDTKYLTIMFNHIYVIVYLIIYLSISPTIR